MTTIIGQRIMKLIRSLLLISWGVDVINELAMSIKNIVIAPVSR